MMVNTPVDLTEKLISVIEIRDRIDTLKGLSHLTEAQTVELNFLNELYPLIDENCTLLVPEEKFKEYVKDVIEEDIYLDDPLPEQWPFTCAHVVVNYSLAAYEYASMIGDTIYTVGEYTFYGV